MLTKLLIFISLVFISFSCTKEKKDCNCSCLPDALDKYNYPVKPGTSAWNNIHSTDGLFLACQIPSTILKNLSTSGLVQSCIENPQTFFQFAFSDKIRGRDELFERLNCYQELTKRPDGAVKLFERYKLMNPRSVENMTTDSERGGCSLSFYYIEILLTKDSIINQLNISQKKQLAITVVENDSVKSLFLNVFGLSRTSGIMILSALMETAFYQPYIDNINQNNDLKTFTKTGLLTADGIYDLVLMHTKKFIL